MELDGMSELRRIINESSPSRRLDLFRNWQDQYVQRVSGIVEIDARIRTISGTNGMGDMMIEELKNLKRGLGEKIFDPDNGMAEVTIRGEMVIKDIEGNRFKAWVTTVGVDVIKQRRAATNGIDRVANLSKDPRCAWRVP